MTRSIAQQTGSNDDTMLSLSSFTAEQLRSSTDMRDETTLAPRVRSNAVGKN